MNDVDKQRAHWFSAEMLIAYECAKQGWIVSVPLAPCSYDLLVDTEIGIRRLQIKRAKFRKQRIKPSGKGDRDHYWVELVRHTRTSAGDRKHKRVEPNAFDFLVAVCQPDLVYIIPSAKLSSEDGAMLRGVMIKQPIEGRKDSEQAGVRWEAFKNNFLLING